MKEIKLKGIVLSSKDYSESDKIISIFCELGVISAKLKGVKKGTAKLSFAAQPFAFVEFVLIKSGNFYTCINATSIDQFFSITEDFDNYIFMLACMEICLKTVKENDPQNELFLLLLNSLKIVCYDNAGPMPVFIKFVIDSMRILGYMIKIDGCAICSKRIEGPKLFSFDFNGFLCQNCCKGKDALELSEGEFAILRVINNTPLNKLSTCRFLSRENLVSIISLLVKEVRLITGINIESIEKFL